MGGIQLVFWGPSRGLLTLKFAFFSVNCDAKDLFALISIFGFISASISLKMCKPEKRFYVQRQTVVTSFHHCDERSAVFSVSNFQKYSKF